MPAVALKSALPPGPKNFLLQTYLYTRDSYGYLERMRDTYGDLYTVPVVNGTVVMAGSPATAQQIFSADPDTFVPFAVEAVTPLVGTHSLLFLSGARHRRERKLLMPAFHGDRMRAHGETIREAAQAAAARWTSGKSFAFQDTSQSISLDVIIRVVFGVTDPRRVEAVRKAIIDFVDVTVPALLFFPFLQRSFFGRGPWARFLRAKAAVSALLRAEIRARQSRPETTGDDILSSMLAARHEDGSAMSEDELHDELLTLLFAGHETTGIALAWAIYWLLRNPDCMQRLVAEIDAAGERPEPEVIARLPYLDAVVQETLRLYPIAPDVPRKLARPLVLGDYTLQPGTAVAVGTALLHTRPDLYPEPRRFNPERFLDRKFSPFEYTPFGGGARRCLGAAFATYEMKIVLATLLGQYRLTLDEPREVRPGRRSVVLGPSTGVRVVLSGRRGAFARVV
jgi:cytochrome P450